jgi:hypothetical protein
LKKLGKSIFWIIILTVFIATIAFFLIDSYICLFNKEKSKFYNKPSIIAGYKSGTFFDVHLLLYPDSTYYYSNSDKDPTGNWIQLSDTIILKQRDTIQSVLVNNKPILINNPRYNWLHQMEFIKNNYPRIVTFPKQN